MKEYPILFSTEMVRAILAGRKTQTRRVILPQPKMISETTWHWKHPQTSFPALTYKEELPERINTYLPSRYGQKGDTLWVRETWNSIPNYDITGDPNGTGYLYKADGNLPHYIWEPSIYMPRAAARLFLRNEGEKIERLQDISEADAAAEGIEPKMSSHLGRLFKNYRTEGHWWHSPVNSFSTLWDSINAAPKPAKRNPYTGEKEACYISFPWSCIRDTETYRGKTHYIVGNPWVRAISFSKI